MLFRSASNIFGSATSDVVTLAITPVTCTAPSSGLVGWWRAEGVGVNETGGQSALLQGTASYGSGEVGYAFQFGSSGSPAVKVAANSNLNVGLGAGFTIEAWIKRSDSLHAGLPVLAGTLFGGSAKGLPLG